MASYADAVAYLVRYLIRNAIGAPAGYVRPANQPAPTGAQGAEFATVLILEDTGTAYPEITRETTQPGDMVTETRAVFHSFTASVQFFKHANPAPDAAGISPFGMSAFSQAARLPMMLTTPNAKILADELGLAFISATPARNLAALADEIWEDRGSIDLDFVVENPETALINSLQVAQIEFRHLAPDGVVTTHTIEVTS